MENSKLKNKIAKWGTLICSVIIFLQCCSCFSESRLPSTFETWLIAGLSLGCAILQTLPLISTKKPESSEVEFPQENYPIVEVITEEPTPEPQMVENKGIPLFLSFKLNRLTKSADRKSKNLILAIEVESSGNLSKLEPLVCKDSFEPKVFQGEICIDYIFENYQLLRFSLSNLEQPQNSIVGTASCLLADILKTKSGFFLDLQSGSESTARLYIACRKSPEHEDFEIDLNFCMSSVASDESLSDTPSPLFHILKIFRPKKKEQGRVVPQRGEDWLLFHEQRSESQRANVKLNLIKSCHNDLLKLEQWKQQAEDQSLVAWGYASINSIMNGKPSIAAKDSVGKQVEPFKVDTCSMKKEVADIVDMIEDGKRLEFVVAVDFTSSNGDPNTPGTLHYLGAGPSPYERAIEEIGKRVLTLKRQDEVTAFGFGALVGGVHKSIFPLTHQRGKSNVYLWDNLREVYYNTVYNTQFAGPTHFQPVIKTVVDLIKSKPEESRNYTVLLLITDGRLDDFDSTVSEIKKASLLPISVIFVGVCSSKDSQFGLTPQIEVEQLKHGRDMAKFITFERSANNKRLAEDVLKDLPDKMLDFYYSAKQPAK